jgi:hypothetical protein
MAMSPAKIQTIIDVLFDALPAIHEKTERVLMQTLDEPAEFLDAGKSGLLPHKQRLHVVGGNDGANTVFYLWEGNDKDVFRFASVKVRVLPGATVADIGKALIDALKRIKPMGKGGKSITDLYLKAYK